MREVLLGSVYTSHWSQTAGQMLSCCHHPVGAARHPAPAVALPSLVPGSTNDPNACSCCFPAGESREGRTRGRGGALHIKGVLIAECNMHICTTPAMHTTICIIQMQAVAAILRLSLILRWNLHPWRNLMYAKDRGRMAGGLCGGDAPG